MLPKDVDSNTAWDWLENQIAELRKRVHNGSSDQPILTSEQYIHMYTVVFNLCYNKSSEHNAEHLYRKFKETCQVFYQDMTEVDHPVTKNKSEDDEYSVLRQAVKLWRCYTVIIRLLPNIFYYLNCYYLPRMSLLSLDEVVEGFKFRDLVYGKVDSCAARKVVLRFIDRERNGEKIDRKLVKNVISVFVNFGKEKMEDYEKGFEAMMLECTGDYYSLLAMHWSVKKFSDRDYVLKVEECSRLEGERASEYLHPNSEQKVVSKVQHELFKPLAENLKQKVVNEGVNLVQDAVKNTAFSPEHVLVTNLIELHDIYMEYIKNCFKNYSPFHKALREAFEVLCNQSVVVHGIANEELVARFCDGLLKKGGTLMSDMEIDQTLEKVITKLLPYFRDRDIFAEFYRKRLAHRLLFDRSRSQDHELGILIQMKQRFGPLFTKRMEVMINDLRLSDDIQLEFQEFWKSNSTNSTNVNHFGMDFTVNVLTFGIWPSYKSSGDVLLPEEMLRCVETFKDFYETKTRHRRLTWLHSLGQCSIIGNFELKQIELSLQTYQAALLLLFNNAHKLTYSEIAKRLNLCHEDLVRVLHSLSCSHYKILIKKPDTKTVSLNDEFEFNSRFTHVSRKIKISLPPAMTKAAEERKEVTSYVSNERKYAIDAAIVRIMKSRRILEFQKLVAECVERMEHMFKPDIRLIKKRIEDLISRDYLERDSKNCNLLRYIV